MELYDGRDRRRIVCRPLVYVMVIKSCEDLTCGQFEDYRIPGKGIARLFRLAREDPVVLCGKPVGRLDTSGALCPQAVGLG